MPDTVILKDEGKLIKHLFGFLNNRISPLKLCHRASRYGWSGQQFHQHCDDKADTVVLVKVGNYIFGGYTDQTWQGIRISKMLSLIVIILLSLMHIGLCRILSMIRQE